ncbi:MAG: M15 family metallopeptidase [Actinomycetota bacterium]
MAEQKGKGRRLRRLISLTLILGLLGWGALSIGAPEFIAKQLETLPEQVREVAAGATIKEATIFDPPINSIDQADSIWVVVNKHRPLKPVKYKPATLVQPNFAKPKKQNPFGLSLRLEAAQAAEQMAIDMAAAGKGQLILNSGFRSYRNQTLLYAKIRDTQGLAVAEQLSARPGFSEHQTGLAADFAATGQGCAIMVCFSKTDAGIWLRQNAYRYGFVLRYPAKMTPVTGYQFEPWHFRFVGVELATEMRTKGIRTLEEFWQLGPAPDYLPAN